MLPRLAWLLLAAFCLSAVADPLLVKLPDGSYLKLVEKDGGARWENAREAELSAPEFQRPLGETQSAGGRVRIVSGRRIELWDGRRWLDSGLLPPPKAITYTAAHLDAAGNLAVELGGRGKGFNYIAKGGSVIVANRISWKTDPPAFKEMAPNPEGPGYLAIAPDGAVWRIQPPGPKHKSFLPAMILPAGSAQRFHPWADGKTLIAAPDKTFAMLTGTADSTPTLSPIPYPSGTGKPLSLEVFSSRVGRVQSSEPEPPAIPARMEGAPLESKAQLSAAELAKAIGERRARVTEYEALAKFAESKGLRVYLFGGTAAAFGHYVRWDVLAEKGDPRFQKERFNYDFTSIYKTTQDLDIVVTRADGTKETTAEIEELEKFVQKKYPYMTGEKGQWEVRGLRTARGTKEALVDNPDFQNQHTDSNSTGLIELTTPPGGGSAVRDLRDESESPRFLTDLATGKLHYYFSPAHERTARAKRGMNPPILSAIRYLTKAFQYGLAVEPEAVPYLQQIVADFDPKAHRDAYVVDWIEKNGKKLFQNAVDLEYAWNKLEELGLRKKLLAIHNNPGKTKSLAWWMNKEPLRARDYPGSHQYKNGNWANAKPGRTAGELGIVAVAHETSDFEAYESIIASPIGSPKVFISRSGSDAERANFGDGFYTKIGLKGAVETGFHIRFEVDPTAVEGVDFIQVKEHKFVIWKNAAKLRVIPDSLRINPLAALKYISDPKNRDEKGLLELLRRKLGKHQFDDAERAELAPLIAQEAAKWRAKKEPLSTYEKNFLLNWFHLPATFPPLDSLLPRPDLFRLYENARDESDQDRILFKAVEGLKTPEDFLTLFDELVAPPGRTHDKKREERLLNAHWDDFVHLRPSELQLARLKSACKTDAAEAKFGLLELDRSLDKLKGTGYPLTSLTVKPFKQVEDAQTAMHLALPYAKAADDFPWMLSLLAGKSDAVRDAKEAFLLQSWASLMAASPTPAQLGAIVSDTVRSSRGWNEVMGHAFDWIGSPGGLDRFTAFIEATKKQAGADIRESFFLARLEAYLAGPPPGDIATFKRLEKLMVTTEKGHGAAVRRGLTLVKTAPEFLEVMEFTAANPNKDYRYEMSKVLQGKLEWFFGMSPTIEEVFTLKRGFIYNGKDYLSFLAKALPLAATPDHFTRLFDREGVAANDVDPAKTEALFLPHLDRFMELAPTLDQTRDMEKALSTKAGADRLRERAVKSVRSIDDFIRLAKPSRWLSSDVDLADAETFTRGHLERLLTLDPRPSVTEWKRLEREIPMSEEGRLELMTRGVELCKNAEDFLRLAEAPSRFGNIFGGGLRKRFVALNHERFLALEPTPQERRRIDHPFVATLISGCYALLRRLISN